MQPMILLQRSLKIENIQISIKLKKKNVQPMMILLLRSLKMKILQIFVKLKKLCNPRTYSSYNDLEK